MSCPRAPPHLRGVELLAHAKVGELARARRVDQHVRRLEVAVDRVLLLVQVRQPVEDLHEKVGDHLLGKPRVRPLRSLEEMRDGAHIHVLEREVDAALVQEGVVEREQVVAARVVHELHLVEQQPPPLGAGLQVILQDLEGERLVRRPVRRQVHLGARAAAQLVAHLELVEPEGCDLALQQRTLRDAISADGEVLL